MKAIECTNLEHLNNLLMSNGLTIFHQNIRSLNKHIDDLRLMISGLKNPPPM